jgi:hypothetical protein
VTTYVTADGTRYRLGKGFNVHIDPLKPGYERVQDTPVSDVLCLMPDRIEDYRKAGSFSARAVVASSHGLRPRKDAHLVLKGKTLTGKDYIICTGLITDILSDETVKAEG